MKSLLLFLLINCIDLPLALADTEAPLLLGKTFSQAKQQAISPDDALNKLIAGNKRFVSNQGIQRDYLAQAKQSSYGQFPFAIVLNCMDSRSVPEMIFDQGIADIFTLRVAGNILNDDILGSMEFGAKAAGAKLVVVMGHTSCGAVAGACNQVQLGNLDHVLNKIQPVIPAVKKTMPEKTCADMDLVDAIAKANAIAVAQQIPQRSPLLKALVDKGELAIVVAMHNIKTGQVEFLNHKV
ncbi:carbonic anhydrase family protein [Legionella micdadei]|uniref:Carbonic anhydrase n=1 Tax=Legionella micdadei TaxID=451 RepID=A0A098GGY5_LEGMI|nr:carbonic anhydrase family protein [Legionella micdadei]ARG97672.1 carbonic anhydrase [Legionella micdadei]ARH00015.1 carbonic anhydrase [Legionella micdadei]KTD27762.1 carbonic anhydrase [Legionella micdadei]NSL17747.1 carbonic anhydrase [Legionella micdadei]CEG60751.1 Carbonic anhydrase Mig5 [Legionella micdadei]